MSKLDLGSYRLNATTSFKSSEIEIDKISSKMTHMGELHGLKSSLISAISIRNFFQYRVYLKKQNVLINNNTFLHLFLPPPTPQKTSTM
jgi:hypothetical protein